MPIFHNINQLMGLAVHHDEAHGSETFFTDLNSSKHTTSGNGWFKETVLGRRLRSIRMTVVGEMCFIRAIKDIERGSLNSSRMACLSLRAMEQRRSLTESSAKKVFPQCLHLKRYLLIRRMVL